MIRKIEAMVLFVQDLAECTVFYRDTFRLQYQGSDADSATFLLQDGLYLILLSPKGSADLLGTEGNSLKIAGGPRGLLAAGVEDVDAAYEELKAKGVTFIRPQPTSAGGYARRTLPIPKAPFGRSTSPLNEAREVSEAVPNFCPLTGLLVCHQNRGSSGWRRCVRMNGGINTCNATSEIWRSSMKVTAPVGPS